MGGGLQCKTVFMFLLTNQTQTEPTFSSGRGAQCSYHSDFSQSGSDMMSPNTHAQEEEDKRLEELLLQHRAETAFYTDKNLPMHRQVRCPRVFAVIIALVCAGILFWAMGYMISQEVASLETRFKGAYVKVGMYVRVRANMWVCMRFGVL